MNKIFILLTLFLIPISTFAQDFAPQNPPHKPTLKEQNQFDKMLDERLNLTDEQKKYIKQNRPKHIKEMEKTIAQMEALRKKIKDVYLLGLPKYQAELRCAPYKAELAILRQNARKQKLENRKNFENILTKEQKEEFEKIRKEHLQKRPPRPFEE